ncbi:ninja-family protein Os05g0558800 isoform X2 [Amborella trichopoda]|uniref:ninja-family protein Os05g0558800 isoform X2 n=1 Tax=Amborella trichopoda TaxID=13333 RepID=UPI0005D2D53D|nr:ninja-family protein Os05g0558800 isoform X2 [Amborella trichopoda]|eukprot:XP_020528662.1 ninja-family protein Os05g0558800 isoform X2 [Amborella trichopoda]
MGFSGLNLLQFCSITMEDDSGIELSLGLSCGGSSGKSKAKDGFSEPNSEEGGNHRPKDGNFTMGDFLQKGIETRGPDGNDSGSKNHENFFTDLGKRPALDSSTELHGKSSQFTGFKDSWITNTEGGNKRKMLFEDPKQQKKVEREAENTDKSPFGVKNSTVSVTTEEVSSADNEATAESETEGSSSRTLSSVEKDGIKRFIGGGSDKRKDKQGFCEPSSTDPQVPVVKQLSVLGNDSNHELGNRPYGMPYSIQPVGIMAMPYPLPKLNPNSGPHPSGSGIPMPYLMQLMPPGSNGERPTIRAMSPAMGQLAFGYSAVQLPTLEHESPWGALSQAQQFPLFGNRGGMANGEHVDNDLRIPQAMVQMPNSSDSLSREGKPSESKSSSKPKDLDGTVVCTSSNAGDEPKGTEVGSMRAPVHETTEPPSQTVFSLEGSGIRPGIAPSVKFGGSGSFPDLPWVSATGSNGKTISGVTYKYDRNQIKIVCACHSYHMSPDEFLHHANTEGLNSDGTLGLAAISNDNQAAST